MRQLLGDQFLKLIDVQAAFPSLPPCKSEESSDHGLNGHLQFSQGLRCHQYAKVGTDVLTD